MDLMEAIEGRRSIRKFTDEPVLEEDIVEIIRAAGLAPSATNQQMWRFLVVRNKTVLEEMRRAITQTVEEMLAWPEAAGLHARIKAVVGYSCFFADAPVGIAVLTTPHASPLESELLPRRDYSFEQIFRLRGAPGIQSVGAAIENLILRAYSLGYGTCWMTGPLYAGPRLEAVLKVEEPWCLAAITPLGRPAEDPGPRPRKDVSEILTFID